MQVHSVTCRSRAQQQHCSCQQRMRRGSPLHGAVPRSYCPSSGALVPPSGCWCGQQTEGQQLSKGACCRCKPHASQGLVIRMQNRSDAACMHAPLLAFQESVQEFVSDLVGRLPAAVVLPQIEKRHGCRRARKRAAVLWSCRVLYGSLRHNSGVVDLYTEYDARPQPDASYSSVSVLLAALACAVVLVRECSTFCLHDSILVRW